MIRRASRELGSRSWAILLAPSLLTLIGVFVAPLAVIVAYGFFRFDPATGEHAAFVFSSYRQLFSSLYSHVLWQTLRMGVEVVVACLVLGFPLAYTMARTGSRLKGLLAIAVLLPLMTSIVVRTYGWIILLGNNGLVPKLLSALHLPRPQLLFSWTGTVIALTEVLLPFMVLTLAAVIEQIPVELEQAAQALGSGRFRVFTDVVWPLALPGVLAGSLLVFVQAISSFATPALVGGAKTQVVPTLVYTEATTALNWPLASAMSTAFLAIVLVCTALQSRLLSASAVAPQRRARRAAVGDTQVVPA